MELSGKLTNKISLSGKLARNSSLSGTILRSTGGSGGAVSSVNGQTGDVVLDAQDVGALPDNTPIPSKTSDLQNDSGFVNASGAAAAAPVQSVNGQTGAVTVSGLSQEAKQALMDCFANTAWAVNNGQTYYNALASALGLRVLSSITAVFTQGSATIYDIDSLDTLKQYLTVTANYSDSTTATVTDYTLSGTLTAGTSTITVSYDGKTDSFNVTVTRTTLMFVGASYGAGHSNGNITFNADESVTLSTSGNTTTWGLCYSPYGNASAFSTWGNLKGHTVRVAYDVDWKSTTTTAHLPITVHLTNDLSKYDGTRLKNATVVDNQRVNANSYYDFVVPSTASEWAGGSGTPTDNSYFSFRVYLLSNTAGANVVLKLKFYDLGVV